MTRAYPVSAVSRLEGHGEATARVIDGIIGRLRYCRALDLPPLPELRLCEISDPAWAVTLEELSKEQLKTALVTYALLHAKARNSIHMRAIETCLAEEDRIRASQLVQEARLRA